MEELKKRIAKVKNFKELEQIKWRLRGPNGEFVGLSTFRCDFVPEKNALIFDGRDNEDLKKRTFERVLGPLTVELI